MYSAHHDCEECRESDEIILQMTERISELKEENKQLKQEFVTADANATRFDEEANQLGLKLEAIQEIVESGRANTVKGIMLEMMFKQNLSTVEQVEHYWIYGEVLGE